MVAAFKKKNTIKENGFSLTENGFFHSGSHYKFIDVVEIARFRQLYETKVLLVGSDYTHQISIVMRMRTGEQLQVTEQATWTSSSNPEIVDFIDNAYIEIAQKSWNRRCEKYLTTLNNHGYFQYGGYKFYPNTKKIVKVATGEQYSKDELKFSRGATTLYGKVKGKSNVLKKLWTGDDSEIVIGTMCDTDVFYALLSQYFGLSWR